jgi:tetratricopeptide (TPR) repeat protein
MAQAPDKPMEATTPPQGEGLLPWSQVWHLPVLLLGMILFVVGIVMVMPRQEPDDFAAAFNSVEQYLIAGSHDDALKKLQEVEPNLPKATDAERGRFDLLMGDVIFLQQQTQGGDLEENHARIVRFYDDARKRGIALDGIHRQRLAETYIALGHDPEAMAVLETMKDEPARMRYTVIKRLIERQQYRAAGVTPDQLQPLVRQFLAELVQESNEKVKRQEQVWAVTMQAQTLLDHNEPQAAADYLLRMAKRLEQPGGEKDLLPMQLLFAKASQQMGDLAVARQWYLYVQGRLDPADAMNADAYVGLGQLDLAETNDMNAALANFSQAETNYAETSPRRPGYQTYLEALVGRGDAEAKLDGAPQAIDLFNRAVKLVLLNPNYSRRIVPKLIDIVRSHYDASFDRGEFDLALKYLEVLEPLPDQPTDMLVELALVHERIAQRRLVEAETPGPDGQPVPAEARKLLNQDAAGHFEQAGDYYVRHAHAVTIVDDQAHGQSLWNAAHAFDQAQLWKRAIETYAEFAATRPSDPRQLEAQYRLGQAYMADGQYSPAADIFADLILNHPRNNWSFESLVPLARAQVALGRFDEAEQGLLHVVNQHPAITPESPPYRDALIELGRLYYHRNRFADAIARLDEAVTRYGDHEQGATLRFMLADAMRQSIDELDKELAQPMPQSKRAARQAERARRLEQGQVLYSQVISDLESRSELSMTDAQRLYLRNSYFYRADCAYDLGRFETAIELYDLAAKRYDRDPSSLVALVQIVNAYCELGDVQAAAAMNNRARDHLSRIPEEAFENPNLPMQREHWQRWLQFTAELNLLGTQANSTPAAPAVTPGG